MTWIMLTIFVGGVAILGVVVGWRWLDAQRWQRSLAALSLQFPCGLKADQVSAWLSMLGSLRTPVALEIVATGQAMSHFLLVPKPRQAEVLAGTRGLLAGLRVEDAPDYLKGHLAPSLRTATELRLTHLSHQLATDRAETAVAAFLASLGQLKCSGCSRVRPCPGRERRMIQRASWPRPRKPSMDTHYFRHVAEWQCRQDRAERVRCWPASLGRCGCSMRQASP
jgi:hypothetical protein